MTPYHIDWTGTALDMLADIWMQATNRRAVNAAESQVNAILARDPIGRGHHLGEGLYKVVVHPLVVFYSVDQTRKSVEISVVWYIP